MDWFIVSTILARILAIVLLVAVIIKQKEALKSPDLHWLKMLLTFLVLIILFGNLFTIFLNIFRQSDGNLYVQARRVSMVWNSVSAVCTGVILYKIYTYKE